MNIIKIKENNRSNEIGKNAWDFFFSNELNLISNQKMLCYMTEMNKSSI